jgi:hypothetical protein
MPSYLHGQGHFLAPKKYPKIVYLILTFYRWFSFTNDFLTFYRRKWKLSVIIAFMELRVVIYGTDITCSPIKSPNTPNHDETEVQYIKIHSIWMIAIRNIQMFQQVPSPSGLFDFFFFIYSLLDMVTSTVSDKDTCSVAIVPNKFSRHRSHRNGYRRVAEQRHIRHRGRLPASSIIVVVALPGSGAHACTCWLQCWVTWNCQLSRTRGVNVTWTPVTRIALYILV